MTFEALRSLLFSLLGDLLRLITVLVLRGLMWHQFSQLTFSKSFLRTLIRHHQPRCLIDHKEK
jgi:hypothetical protein